MIRVRVGVEIMFRLYHRTITTSITVLFWDIVDTRRIFLITITLKADDFLFKFCTEALQLKNILEIKNIFIFPYPQYLNNLFFQIINKNIPAGSLLANICTVRQTVYNRNVLNYCDIFDAWPDPTPSRKVCCILTQGQHHTHAIPTIVTPHILFTMVPPSFYY